MDGRLLVFTGADSWKVKRLRHDPRVRVAACNFRGHLTSDDVQAIATVLGRSGIERVYRAICQQYGRAKWLYALFTDVGGGVDTRAGIEITSVTDDTNARLNDTG